MNADTMVMLKTYPNSRVIRASRRRRRLEEGDHLKPCPFVRQPGEAEQDREQLRDDPVQQDDKRKQDECNIDVHVLTSLQMI